MIAYLDIETASRPDWLIQQVKVNPEWRSEDFAAWVDEHAADGALSAWTGQVVCWAVATDDGREWNECGYDERAMLVELLDLLSELRPAQIVIHNGHEFDVPFLRLRALALKLPRLAKGLWTAKPWDEKVVDTAGPTWFPRPPHARKGWEFNLDAIAELLEIHRPPTLPGSRVPAAWYRGDLDSIRTHCLDDVRTLRLVHPALAEGRAA